MVGKPSRISCTRAHLSWTAPGVCSAGLKACAEAPLPGAVDDQLVTLSSQVTAPQGRDFGVRQARGDQGQDQGVTAPEEPVRPPVHRELPDRLVEDVGDGL